MWCLTLAANAVVTWTTEYHGLAVTALRRAGRNIDDAVLAHIWPTHHENVHFYDTHSVDVDGELAKLDAVGVMQRLTGSGNFRNSQVDDFAGGGSCDDGMLAGIRADGEGELRLTSGHGMLAVAGRLPTG